MCFIKKQKTKPKVRIAKEDIICWKMVVKVSDGYRSEYNYTPDFRYKLNETAYALDNEGKRIKEFEIEYYTNMLDGSRNWAIHYGLYSYENIKDRLLRGVLVISSYFTVLKCVIPKGTKYLSNNKQYVSMKLKPIKAYVNGDRI